MPNKINGPSDEKNQQLGVLKTEAWERDYCDQLVRTYSQAVQELNQAQATMQRALAQLRGYGDMVARRHGLGGEWMIFDRDNVLVRQVALERGVAPFAFSTQAPVEESQEGPS